MPMIPPLVREPSLGEQRGFTGHPVSARMARTQRRYASNYNISYVYRAAEADGPARACTRARTGAGADVCADV